MVDTAYFLALFLVFLRLSTFFLLVGIFYPKGTPNVFKVALAMIIAYFITSTIDSSVILSIDSNYSLAMSIINEVMTGAVLGVIINLLFNVVKAAGGFMDMQLGLSMMNMVDPNSNTQSTLLGTMSYYIAAVMFFVANGHHILIKCLTASFNIVKVGQSIVFTDNFYIMLQGFIKFFIIGVRIALPIMLIAVITDLTMSLISRSVPTINVMILGMPVRIVVGLISFTVFLPILVKLFLSAVNMIPDMLETILKSLPAASLFIVFADDGDKTEEATPKRKADAKKKGQVPRSKDVGLALTMLTCTIVILAFSTYIVGNMKSYMLETLQHGMYGDISISDLGPIFKEIIIQSLTCVLPVTVPIMIAGITASLMQTGFILTGEGLKPSLGKLNPINGFKNMFSKRSAADLLKNVAVVSILTYIGYNYVKDNYNSILQISNSYLPSLGENIKKIILGIFSRISLILVVIAVLDYFVQYKFNQKDMRMSKQEIKEEYKQMEGDPKIKGKIKQKQREMATRRMMAEVPDATVVITNPTHLAIALKYEEGVTGAPKVVAKGADLIALKIKEIAKENDVPIIENKPLARMMFKEVELDQEIPQDMYEAVAEILAMVYKLKN
ncbi:flagellar biosynthetic protein FliR/FlhB [Clostridium sp. DSM 8431]|uniref:fused FliR family export protein/FlhB family type III secretion system protein n=1 Tax=Clostridium sp. DSM 8431 TaxID=1761781 RepID=UPI0008E5A8B7|nr:fused FliR family export protein/FlhB family type III secretion system protein [Clostridium sp. DSM 8431]SFU31018.1 flagellar biosynthetic protein FliR/FlhB [Clostridium sp. DSM 8431]